MAKKGAKKTGGAKPKGHHKPPKTDAPQMIAAKGGPSQSQLLEKVMATMDEENWLTKKQGRDFVESLKAVIEDTIMQGQPVNLFGVVKLVPRYHTAGKREVNKEFGNPDSGKMTKTYKPKVSLKATPLKPIKDALPNAAKMAKAVGK